MQKKINLISIMTKNGFREVAESFSQPNGFLQVEFAGSSVCKLDKIGDSFLNTEIDINLACLIFQNI